MHGIQMHSEPKYCPECGEPIDECQCDLMDDRTPELKFDDDSVVLFDEDVLFEEEY